MSGVNCVESKDVVSDAMPDPPRDRSNEDRDTIKESPNVEKCDPENHEKASETRESSESTNQKSSKSKKKKKSLKSTINIIGSNFHYQQNTNYVLNQHVNSGEAQGKSRRKGTRKMSDNVDETARTMPDNVKKLCQNQTRIAGKHISDIAKYLGDYREFGMKLGFLTGQIDQFESDHNLAKDIVSRILTEWKSWKASKATIGVLMEAMWSCKEYDCAERFAEIYKVEGEQ